MKIAFDTSPLTSGHYLQNVVRGSGYYITNLKKSLVEHFPQNEYYFLDKNDEVPEKAEIVHYPYFEPFFITIPRKRNKKIVVTVHDLTPIVFNNVFPAGIKGRIRWKIQKYRLRRVDSVITDSGSSKKDIIEYTGVSFDKVHTVYLAASDTYKVITKKNQLENVAKKYNLPDKFLLYVGDATWNKNLPNLIKAVNGTDYNLVIVGKVFKDQVVDKKNKWNESLLEAKELARGNNKIIPLGFVEDRDLAVIYNLATVFIMPSFYEGFGLPVLEAMNSGLPVITSDKGSLHEVGGESVMYVDPYSVESIKGGIKKLMEDEQLRKSLTEKGLKRGNTFSWKKTAENTLKVYEKLLVESK